MSQKQIMTIVVTPCMCRHQLCRDSKHPLCEAGRHTDNHSPHQIACSCIAIVVMGIYSLITGHYILNV